MVKSEWIAIELVCKNYGLKVQFMDEITQYELITIELNEGVLCLHKKQLGRLEQIIRLHQELNINLEGVDVVMNLLDRIQTLENELRMREEEQN